MTNSIANVFRREKGKRFSWAWVFVPVVIVALFFLLPMVVKAISGGFASLFKKLKEAITPGVLSNNPNDAVVNDAINQADSNPWSVNFYIGKHYFLFDEEVFLEQQGSKLNSIIVSMKAFISGIGYEDVSSVVLACGSQCGVSYMAAMYYQDYGNYIVSHLTVGWPSMSVDDFKKLNDAVKSLPLYSSINTTPL